MDKPWYRNLFSRSQESATKPTDDIPDRGDAEVQFGLGLKLANGEGAARDYGQALEWYRKAAEQGHCLAQFNLGIMFAAGQGAPRDEAEAMAWFGKAAKQGDAGAQFHLGRSQQRASFGALPEAAVEARIEAYKWYRLAAAQNYVSSTTAYTTMILTMTRADVADGERRAAAFVAVKTQPLGIGNHSN